MDPSGRKHPVRHTAVAPVETVGECGIRDVEMTCVSEETDRTKRARADCVVFVSFFQYSAVYSFGHFPARMPP